MEFFLLATRLFSLPTLAGDTPQRPNQNRSSSDRANLPWSTSGLIFVQAAPQSVIVDRFKNTATRPFGSVGSAVILLFGARRGNRHDDCWELPLSLLRVSNGVAH